MTLCCNNFPSQKPLVTFRYLGESSEVSAAKTLPRQPEDAERDYTQARQSTHEENIRYSTVSSIEGEARARA